jgi:hypothetical protein
MSEAQTDRACGLIGWTVWLGLVILTPAYLCRPAVAKAVQAGSSRVVSQVVDNWIAVVQAQCDRRLYAQAEDSLLRARQYQPYFNEQQNRKIDELSEEVEQSMSERTRLLQNTDEAGRLIEEGEFLKARGYLHEAVKSKVLSDEERNRVKLTLQRVEAKITEQRRLMADLYKRSRRYYKQGDFEQAREGFAVVASSGLYVPSMGKTAEEYLAAIEQGTVKHKSGSKSKIRHSESGSSSKVDTGLEPAAAATPEGFSHERFGNESQQDRAITGNLKQSYLRAVMRDAQTKVTEHVGKAEFSLAKAVVQNARDVLQKYRADIGEELYKQHSERLQELSRIIDEQQMRWELRWDTKDSGL